MPLTADIDGSDITAYCQRIAWRPRLNLIDSASVRFPSGLVGYSLGESELHVWSGGTLKFSGPTWYTQPEGGVDAAYTELTAYDHRIHLPKRLCKDVSAHPAGNLITPGQVILDNVTAPAILAQFIVNSIAIDGTLPLAVGTVDAGGADVSGVPTDFPMSIDRMRNLLTSTGQLDQILHPGVGSSTLDLLNDYTNDLSGSVVFEYATGAHNAQVATVTVDMKDVINALWYLLGPRKTEERWRGSITPTAPHPGGVWPGALIARFMASRAAYGYMQEIRIFDDKDDENSIRPLFEEEWANEAWLRAVPRTLASVRPQRGIGADDFNVGDIIGVGAGSILDGGFSGGQTVYGFDWITDHDGVDELEEILTSHDATGAA